MIDVSDLLPTFCELAGAVAPLGLDGVSIAPTLSGTGHQRTREFLIHEAGGGASIIRGNYKLILGKKASGLYDLQADHAEENNIAADHPELVKELSKIDAQAVADADVAFLGLEIRGKSAGQTLAVTVIRGKAIPPAPLSTFRRSTKMATRCNRCGVGRR